MSSTMARIGAFSAVFAAVLIALLQINELIFIESTEDAYPTWASAVYATQLLLIAVALIGLHLHQQHAVGSLGQAATMFSIVGAMCWFAMAVAELGIKLDASGPLDDDPAPVLLGLLIGGFALFVVGLMAFAVVTWRAGVLPWQAAALLLIGIPLGVALMGVVPAVLMVYGAGLAWLGIAALRQARTRTEIAVGASSPSQVV